MTFFDVCQNLWNFNVELLENRSLRKNFLRILVELDHWWQLIECVGLRKHGLGVVSIISWKVGEIKGSKNTLKSRHDQSEMFELQLFSHFSLSQFIQKIKFSPLAPRITTKKKLSKIGCYSYSTTLKTGNVFLCTEIYYRYRIAPWNSSRFFCFPRWPLLPSIIFTHLSIISLLRLNISNGWKWLNMIYNLLCWYKFSITRAFSKF